jgi:hypothetical protein
MKTFVHFRLPDHKHPTNPKNGAVTICVEHDEEENFWWLGIAWCAPGDQFSRKKGSTLAYQRMMGKSGFDACYPTAVSAIMAEFPKCAPSWVIDWRLFANEVMKELMNRRLILYDEEYVKADFDTGFSHCGDMVFHIGERAGVPGYEGLRFTWKGEIYVNGQLVGTIHEPEAQVQAYVSFRKFLMEMGFTPNLP